MRAYSAEERQNIKQRISLAWDSDEQLASVWEPLGRELIKQPQELQKFWATQLSCVLSKSRQVKAAKTQQKIPRKQYRPDFAPSVSFSTAEDELLAHTANFLCNDGPSVSRFLANILSRSHWSICHRFEELGIRLKFPNSTGAPRRFEFGSFLTEKKIVKTVNIATVSSVQRVQKTIPSKVSKTASIRTRTSAQGKLKTTQKVTTTHGAAAATADDEEEQWYENVDFDLLRRATRTAPASDDETACSEATSNSNATRPPRRGFPYDAEDNACIEQYFAQVKEGGKGDGAGVLTKSLKQICAELAQELGRSAGGVERHARAMGLLHTSSAAAVSGTTSVGSYEKQQNDSNAYCVYDCSDISSNEAMQDDGDTAATSNSSSSAVPHESADATVMKRLVAMGPDALRLVWRAAANQDKLSRNSNAPLFTADEDEVILQMVVAWGGQCWVAGRGLWESLAAALGGGRSAATVQQHWDRRISCILTAADTTRGR